ncbi:hypothetical protein [Cytobacillus horneckiae]|uniref:DUF2187 domain-containing protein n=1 Tax=Cytobacillus horneckiae TaxID=549687 RepID=A0A2N0ZFA8_9BACI|nr:hypothetical protein [Cytobacillus horneckiae]MEC1155638.1 hypothetical protein [Cytobacillus horneckiae]MED2936956.1 hypothetical protein [Cytobacillus horneckiae]PKG28192.1 hypothetical protein CWS20_15220 [Cytobacillus horneckiae]
MAIVKGDIIYSNSMRMKGKVIKVKPNEGTALIEFILSQNKEMMLRTTQLRILLLNDLVKVDKKRKRL